MCGRYSLLAELGDLVEQLQLSRLMVAPAPRYNIAPSYGGSHEAPIVRCGEDGARELVAARWWLVPSWWNKPLNRLPAAFNARCEGVAQKPFFKTAFARRRCLVPASGWYEFKGARGAKESYYFHDRGGGLLAFAGLWDTWQAPDGERVTSFAIVTREADALVQPIHSRMPVVLARRNHAPWLEESGDRERLLALLAEPVDSGLEVYRTSGHGNNPRNEGPACIEPWSLQQG